MLISKRLKKIADLVDQNKITCDVGCDHALLSIFLVKEKGLSHTIAADINQGPLDSGIKNAKENNVEDKISFIKSNGFLNVDEKFDIGIVAGMGGVLISNIVKDGFEKLKDKTLVLQPNNGEMSLRETLKELNYSIIDEYLVNENDIDYEIIVAKIDGESNIKTFQDLLVGPVLKNKLEIISKLENKIAHTKTFIKNVDGNRREMLEQNLKTWEETLWNLTK